MNISREKDRSDAELLHWLLSQPAVKAQAFFWNHLSRTERKKAMLAAMTKERNHDQS